MIHYQFFRGLQGMQSEFSAGKGYTIWYSLRQYIVSSTWGGTHDFLNMLGKQSLHWPKNLEGRWDATEGRYCVYAF